MSTAYQHYLCQTLREAAWGIPTAQILAAAIAAVEPAAAVRRHLLRDGATLQLGAQRYDLTRYRQVYLVGAGKAAAPMAAAAAEVLGPQLSRGIVVTKDGHHDPQLDQLPSSVTLLEAGHPIPDQRGADAGAQIAALLATAGPDDLLILLLSGGGSALLTHPAPGVNLADLQTLTGLLLRCGASINEINALRKHLDQLKGGGVARLAAPATQIALILSDVVGSPLDVIASGPSVADPTSYADAWAVLEHYQLVEQTPAAIVAHLQRGLAGQAAETLKPGDAVLERVQNLIIGDNAQAASAAQQAAQALGCQTLLLTRYLQGEAREVGRTLAAILREMALHNQPLPRPACLIAGGETTVTLRGNGRGGRNQELALAAMAELAGLERVALISLATDGGDGPTDAAGAVVSGQSLARAQAQGLNWAEHLAHNDAYPFFAALGDLLQPGPTRTNVNDLIFLFAW